MSDTQTHLATEAAEAPVTAATTESAETFMQHGAASFASAETLEILNLLGNSADGGSCCGGGCCSTAE